MQLFRCPNEVHGADLRGFWFRQAREELTNLEKEFAEDYFLKSFAKKIAENAKIVYFDTYCKIYNAVDLNKVAD